MLIERLLDAAATDKEAREVVLELMGRVRIVDLTDRQAEVLSRFKLPPEAAKTREAIEAEDALDRFNAVGTGSGRTSCGEDPCPRCSGDAIGKWAMSAADIIVKAEIRRKQAQVDAMRKPNVPTDEQVTEAINRR